MQPIPFSRWNAAYLALRWRYLFGFLPLLGLLVGLACHVVTFQREHCAVGEIVIEAICPAAGTPLSPGGIPVPTVAPDSPLALEEWLAIPRSDQILNSVVAKLDLPSRWEVDPATARERLRHRIGSGFIPGTVRVRISVTGRKTAATVEIARAVVAETAARVEELEAPVRARREAARIRQFGEDLADARSQLKEWESSAPEPGRSLAEQRSLIQLLEIRLLAEPPCICRSGPVMDWPSLTAPIFFWEDPRLLCRWTGLATGTGILLAILLAYLLEAVFPRKAAVPGHDMTAIR